MERVREYHLTAETSPEELSATIKRDVDNDPAQEVGVRIIPDAVLDPIIVQTLFVLVEVLLKAFNRGSSRSHETITTQVLEREYDVLMREYGPKAIEFNIRKRVQEWLVAQQVETEDDPFDNVFGIWKDDPIDARELREQAWRGNKQY